MNMHFCKTLLLRDYLKGLLLKRGPSLSLSEMNITTPI